MKRFLYAVVVIAVAAVAAGLLLGGCGSGDGTTTEGEVVTGETSGDKVTTDTENGDEKETRPAEEQLLYDYFEAVDEGRYRDAFDMRTMSLQPDADFEEFAASYRDYVKGVRVVSVKRLPEFSSPGREEFQVELDATYIKPYPAGSGQIPPFFILVPHPDREGAWLIDSEGTGP